MTTRAFLPQSIPAARPRRRCSRPAQGRRQPCERRPAPACGPLASRVEHDGDSDGLGRFGPAERRGHRPRVPPGWPGNYLERLPEVGNPPRQRAVDLGQLHANRRYVGGLDRACMRDASQRGLQCADTAALRWMAERSEAVIPKTQWAHAGRDSGSLAGAGGAGVRELSQGFTVAPHSSLSQCQRMPPLGRFVRPIGIPRQPSGAQRRERLDWDKRRPVP